MIHNAIDFAFRNRITETGFVRAAPPASFEALSEMQTSATAIIGSMARGWESKSIEAQQEEAATAVTPGKPRLTGEEAAHLREKENLRLSLRRVSEQLESCRDSRRRSMLEHAKTDLEQKIAQLNP